MVTRPEVIIEVHAILLSNRRVVYAPRGTDGEEVSGIGWLASLTDGEDTDSGLLVGAKLLES